MIGQSPMGVRLSQDPKDKRVKYPNPIPALQTHVASKTMETCLNFILPGFRGHP